MNTRLVAFFAAVLLGFGFGLNALGQGRSRCVFVELFSASNIFSASYEAPFKGSDVFGWRAGLGYSINTLDDDNDGSDGYTISLTGQTSTGISVPLGVNALFGHKTSKFEVGVGITPGAYPVKEKRYYQIEDDRGHTIRDGWESYGPAKWHFGCAFSVDLGYRLQRSNGFCFRVGISPTLEVNSYHTGANVMSVFPYVGFGYAF